MPAGDAMPAEEEQPHRARAAAIVAAVAGLTLALAGCTANAKKASTGFAPSASASAGGGTAVEAAPSSGAPARSGPATSPPILTARQIVYTADITVRTKDIKTTVSAVQHVADADSGIVFAEQVDLAPKTSAGQDGGIASATVTLKVPPEQLTKVLDQVSALGTELGRNEHADDVTSQVVDVGARLQAAQDSLNRLEQLFQHAGSVADLTNVEAQIAQREADLDSLEAQQRTLSAQVAQATITINLVGTPPPAPAAPPAPKKPHVVGFVRGLRGGWHAFTAAAAGIATAIGALLPFLIVLVALAAVGLVVWRRVARNRSRRPPELLES